MKSGLYIVATPIGNLNDISPRALQTLKDADVIACEDSRVTKKLFSLLGISCARDFIVYQNYNEEEQVPLLLKLLQDGRSIALVSDAGSPLISDPGYKIVRKCRENNVYVTVIPGCCAVICALQLAGLPTHRFMFVGFIPNKDKARSDLFKEVSDINTTLVFYETAPRLIKTLTAMKAFFQNRETAVVRELTKMYEEYVRGSLDDLTTHFSTKTPKGEFVIIVSPPQEKTAASFDAESILRAKLNDMPLKSVVKSMTEEYGMNKNEAYALALRIKNES